MSKGEESVSGDRVICSGNANHGQDMLRGAHKLSSLRGRRLHGRQESTGRGFKENSDSGSAGIKAWVDAELNGVTESEDVCSCGGCPA